VMRVMAASLRQVTNEQATARCPAGEVTVKIWQ
jgi:hypothetical protein